MNQKELKNLFTHHPPKDKDQIKRYEMIRETGLLFSCTILDCTPPSADQTAAIRKVREAVMTANAAIALDTAPEVNYVVGASVKVKSITLSYYSDRFPSTLLIAMGSIGKITQLNSARTSNNKVYHAVTIANRGKDFIIHEDDLQHFEEDTDYEKI